MPIDPAASPLGATLTGAGVTFRLWAPAASAVSVRGTFNWWTDTALTRGRDGTWAVFIPGVTTDDKYKFFVSGIGSTGYKRDPYARSLTRRPAFPHANCEIVRERSFPWHDVQFRPPAFIALVLYFGRRPSMSTTAAALEPGKAYYWKVIVEDGNGGTVESELRRFATKK